MKQDFDGLQKTDIVCGRHEKALFTRSYFPGKQAQRVIDKYEPKQINATKRRFIALGRKS